MVYYVLLGSGSAGPLTIGELRQMQIPATTSVWKDGLMDWVSASQLPELQNIVVQAPPPFHQPGAIRPSR
jgi:GYF domain 2